MVLQSSINARMVHAQTGQFLGMDPFVVYAIVIGYIYRGAKLSTHSCLVYRIWKFACSWKFIGLFCAQTLTCLFSLNPSLSPFVFPSMPLRRGIPRRGSNIGDKGCPSRPAPQNVMPITSISPSSPPLGQARSPPHNSFQTSKFTFHNRLNRHVLTASITIILTEEENSHVSLAQTTSSHSQEDSVLQVDMAGVVFN